MCAAVGRLQIPRRVNMTAQASAMAGNFVNVVLAIRRCVTLGMLPR